MSIGTIKFNGSTLKNIQEGIGIISHNIANVNSAGFKEKLVQFSNVESHSSAGDSVSGAKISSTNTKRTQGAIVSTGIASNLALKGQGFFTLINRSGEINYTRAGDFNLDSNNDLVDAAGNYVMSVAGSKINIPDDALSYSINPAGEVYYTMNDQDAIYIDQLQLAIFTNPDNLEALGDNIFRATNSTGNPIFSTAREAGNITAGTSIVAGVVEKSNVDISDSLVQLMAMQRSFQAVSKAITSADETVESTLGLIR
jgi:flagellar hook protein FlgE